MNELPTLNLRELEKLAIREAMRREKSAVRAAKVLGICRATLYRRLSAMALLDDKEVEETQPVHGNG